MVERFARATFHKDNQRRATQGLQALEQGLHHRGPGDRPAEGANRLRLEQFLRCDGLGQFWISDRLGQSDGRTPGQIRAGAGLGDTGPGTARRGPGRLTDLREAMSAFHLFMSAYPPGPDVADTLGIRGVLTQSGRMDR